MILFKPDTYDKFKHIILQAKKELKGHLIFISIQGPIKSQSPGIISTLKGVVYSYLNKSVFLNKPQSFEMDY